MNYFLLSLLSFIAFIALIIVSMFLISKDVYNDATDLISCATKLDKPAKTCGEWDPNANICLKGTCKNCNGDCTANSDKIPLILFIVACVAFIAFTIFFILGFVYKGDNPLSSSQFTYDSLASNSS